MPSDAEDEHPAEKIRYVNLYEDTGKVYVRKISGFYQNIRRYTGLPLIAGYILLPWISIDSRPAILFDLPERKFHILFTTFWPQDFMLLAWLLIIAAFALFTVTVLLGRVYCGFTCPQTVWTLMFISIERLCEGDRNKRIKLDQQDWNINKIMRKSTKHSLWLLLAFITGATFVGYFFPIRELLLGLIPSRDEFGMISWTLPPAAIFWTIFFTGMTYLNAGWMREQVCKYMCPYARFQAVMYDKDTLAVHYDNARGEKRGPRKPNQDYKESGLGDCIDCSWCVQVCPVDIDIRDGLQYECINCGLCVDACNAVMDKMSYPRGLIRYTSEDQLQQGKTHWFRPRLVGYCAAILIMVTAFSLAIVSRSAVDVNIIRDRGVKLYRIAGNEIQNIYTLKINNMDNQSHRYRLELEGEQPFKIKGYRPLEIEAGEVFSMPLRIALPRELAKRDKYPISITVIAEDNDQLTAQEETIFIAPANKE